MPRDSMNSATRLLVALVLIVLMSGCSGPDVSDGYRPKMAAVSSPTYTGGLRLRSGPESAREYERKIMSRVLARWRPYVKDIHLLTNRTAIVEFTLNGAGQVFDLRLVETDFQSPLRWPTDALLKAVRDSSPFGTPPQEMRNIPIELKIGIKDRS